MEKDGLFSGVRGRSAMLPQCFLRSMITPGYGGEAWRTRW